MKVKKILIIFIVMLVIAIFAFFIIFNKNTGKNLKIGNNSSSQEIIDYFLNINSYETEAEIEVNSNKNTNKYIIKQTYKSPNISSQEVIEPKNIQGVKITRNENTLTLENTELNLKDIIENYQYISNNDLDLECFIKDYKENEKSKFEEENEKIIMKTYNSNQTKKKTLYIDKIEKKPIKMEIKDNNKNTSVYILYNKVSINS